MKTFAIVALFLSSVLAFPQAPEANNGTESAPYTPPPPSYGVCTPATYQCRQNADRSWGWDVCDVGSNWVNGGNCARTDICVFNSLNGSPYCVPAPNPGGPGGNPGECTPGKTRCSKSGGRWVTQRCTGSGSWVRESRCRQDETCTYGIYSGTAYCVRNVDARVCRPGTYQCAHNPAKGGWGWEVCAVEGKWVWGGQCAAGETCSFNTLNGSPYCI